MKKVVKGLSVSVFVLCSLLTPQLTNSYEFESEYDEERARQTRNEIYSLYNLHKEIIRVKDTDTNQFGIMDYNGACSTVTVDGTTIPLEEYIAGVVKAEIGVEYDNPELLKSQALVARSFLMNSKGDSSNCSVTNGQSYQAYKKIDPNSERDKAYIQAASATAGQVVSRNGKAALTQYQSYPAGKFQKEDSTGWHVQFQRFANDDSTKWTWNGPSKEIVRSGNNYKGTEMDYDNDHNWGMSQTIAGYLTRKEKYTYQDVIKLFYNEPIVTLTDGKYDGEIKYVSSNFGNIVYWNQGDFNKYYYSEDPYNKNTYKATIKSHGCGPTAVAIVASSMLGKNISPIETTSQVCKIGGCTTGGSYINSLATALKDVYGLKVKRTNKHQEVINALGTNKSLVIVLMGPGTFTSGGHYIVLTGVNEKGQVSVADPGNRQRTNKKWFAFNTIIEEKKASQYIVVTR